MSLRAFGEAISGFGKWGRYPLSPIGTGFLRVAPLVRSVYVALLCGSGDVFLEMGMDTKGFSTLSLFIGLQ
ncbi:MAG: hypothetical protein WA116_04295 [Anaerolineaceae bacterium]